MNYIGSKLKLLPFLEETIINVSGELSDKTFCDIFAGTGIVGRHFKSRSKQIIANDIEHYSYVLNRNYIGNHTPLNYNSLLRELDSLDGIEGFIYSNYCLGGGSGRLYFSDDNGKKIDAIRQKIEDWKKGKKIGDNEYYFLLASLLESADKVANTASVYGAYLKKLKKSALKLLELKPAEYIENDNSHQVYQQDANELIHNIQGDILYMDPPYNARQYGANYHMLNTIALYDDFIPKGKTGMRDYGRSNYCKKGAVSESFEDLIKNADFKYIFLSYNNEGLMSENTVKSIMEKYGDYSLETTEYQRFKADKTENRNHKATSTVEYLHVLVKN